MDCRTARQLSDFDRPRVAELLPREADVLHQHLADCPECAAWVRAERTADERIGRELCDVPVPDGLRERLLARLAGERDAWYRRWLLRGTGVAAAVALLIWFVGFRGRELPALDPQAVCHEAFAQVGATPVQVEEWYRQRDVAMAAPPALDYRYLAFYGLTEFEGRQVPQLVFVRDGSYARVLVLSDRQFDLHAALRQPRVDSGGFTVEVQPYPTADQPRFAFVIISTGGSLDWLRREPPRPST